MYIYACQKCAQSILTLDTRETCFFERYHGGSAVGRTFLLGQSVKPLVSNNHGAQIFGRLTLSDQEGVTQNFCTYILHIKNVNWISSMCHMSSIQLAFWPPSSSVFMDFMGFVGPGSDRF